MIKQYGADAVRWFILSDSPPEKDVQWSDTGVASAHKFLQRIWDLNYLIFNKADEINNKDNEKQFILEINNFVMKIDNSIKNFRFNVSIAYFYEAYRYFKDNLKNGINKNTLEKSIIKIMKLMIPFTPHLAYECLELIGCSKTNNWPKIEKNAVEEIKLAVQINGKTRDILTVKINLDEKELNKTIISKSKANKYIENKKVIKTIFVKNKIINYIVSN